MGECLAGLCRESPFTDLASEAIFAVTDDQPTIATPAKTTNKRHLANEKLTLIFTLTNVLYGTEKVQNGKQQQT
ncbi:hypothetical protein [Mucilaginibacter sp. HD30]